MKVFFKKIARLIYRSLRNAVWKTYITICRHSVRTGSKVFCECSVWLSGFTRIKAINWGDDINKFFFETVTGKSFIMVPYSRYNIKTQDEHYSLIGSIIGFFNLDNTIIYGSGIKNPKTPLVGIPAKIISVRGPLTRAVMLEYGYECPEHYGDPAILLPLFYKPKQTEKNGTCIIPNMGTAKKQNIFDLCNMSGGKIVDMTSYESWTDIIDDIANSSLVVSESLHGLIVAETYGIPNIWVEFIEHEDWWSFKYQDYYESIGKKNMNSIKLYNGYNWDELLKKAKLWKKADIDYKAMLNYFPFAIKDEFVEAKKLING